MENIILFCLALAISVDNLIYGIIYHGLGIKVEKITIIIAALTSLSLIFSTGLISKLLILLFPLIIAKLIGIILLLSFGLIISRDMKECKKELQKDDEKLIYLYQSKENSKTISIDRLINLPLIANKKEVSYLEGILLGIMMNLDGAVINLALGMIQGRIFIISIIFTIVGVLLFKLGQVIVDKNLIYKLGSN